MRLAAQSQYRVRAQQPMTASGAPLEPGKPTQPNGEATTLDVGLEKRLSGVDAKARQKIEDWAKKLVDLSRRNRLLYYRATKRTSLTFRQPSPDAITALTSCHGPTVFRIGIRGGT